jgi:hypothetical protein
MMGISNTNQRKPMVTRDQVRDASSTIAHLWSNGMQMDRIGAARLIKLVPADWRPVVCANIMLMLQQRGEYTQAQAFEGLLFDLAGIEEQ